MQFVLRNADILARVEAYLRRCLVAGELVDVRVQPHQEKRSLEQNAKLHALCNDIAEQRQWAGEWLDTESWKRLFVAALYGQKVVPGVEGGFVVFNKRTSKMTIEECSELIEYIQHWAVENGVKFLADEAA